MKKLAQYGLCLLLSAAFLGCAQVAARDVRPTSPVEAPYRVNEQGMAVYGGEFQFLPFPSGWELLSHAEGGDSVIIYYRKDPGPPLDRTIIIYSEEPYGYSRDLEKRSEEFMKRFLWDVIMTKDIVGRTKTRVLDDEGLKLVVEAVDAVEGKKVKTEIVFARRGERVVAFYATQWRTMDAPYDQNAFQVFGRFVESFRVLKKSFYEEL